MRHAMGVAVFSGMLGVTFFGLFLTPVFYVLLREMEKRVARGSVAGRSQSNTAAHYLLPVTSSVLRLSGRFSIARPIYATGIGKERD